MSGGGVEIELSEGRLRAVVDDVLAKSGQAGSLERLELSSAALSVGAERGLLAAKRGGRTKDGGTLSQGLIRGLLVLSSLAESGPGRSQSKIASEPQMTTTNVSLYVRTLIALGLLIPTGESRAKLSPRSS